MSDETHDARHGWGRFRFRPLSIAMMAVVWVILWGSITPMIVVGGVLCAYLITVVFPLPPINWGGRFRPLWFISLAAHLLKDLVVSSVRILQLAFERKVNLNAGIIRVDLASDSDLYEVVVAELISLVPGTVVVEVVRHPRRLYLHALDLTGPDPIAGVQQMVHDVENRVLNAFGSKEEIAAARELSQVYDQQAARLQQMIAQTPAGQALSRMQDEALIESAYMSGQIDTSTYDQLIAKLHEVKDEGKDAFADLQSAIEGWGKASADAFVEFAFTGKTSFADMTTSILKDLAKMAVYQNVTKPMADGIGEWIKGLLPSANGNVFSEAPGLHRYVNTVQTSPKVFGYGQLHGFANGGVFAEAGPEAVMPLARDTQGRLGVRAQGGGTNVEINLTVHESGATTGNSTGDTTDAWRQFATRIKGMILDEMTTQKRPGGMLYS